MCGRHSTGSKPVTKLRLANREGHDPDQRQGEGAEANAYRRRTEGRWRQRQGRVRSTVVRFLLLTGARRTEASAMTWSELHGANWLLPAARNKTKVSLLRPLSRAAQATLPEKRGTYVFTTDKGKTSFSGYSKAKAKLDFKVWRSRLDAT